MITYMNSAWVRKANKKGRAKRKGEYCEILKFLISYQIYSMSENSRQVPIVIHKFCI